MAQKPLTDSQLIEALTLVEQHGSITDAAKAMGVSRPTLQTRINKARERFGNDGPGDKTKTYELPEILDDDIPVDDIVDQLTTRFEKRRDHARQKEWLPIKMKSDEPIGLMWLGDPHVDDNYCEWPVLRHHLDLINSNAGVYGCGLGDYQNNWVGRLGRLYAEQDTSSNTAWKLVEWLIENMNPLILIGGNHDMWSGSGDPLKWMVGHSAIREDWEARVELQFPNGRTCRIHAAHDMPGHSQWNQLHGQVKMARFRQNADLFISGHKHNWALSQIELVEQERTAWLARARGYKYRDTYAQVKGFEQQNFGQAILQVIDPGATHPAGFVHCFADVDLGIEFLQFLRDRG